MIPQYIRLGSSEKPKPLISINFGRFAVGIVCLPLFAFLFCILWSILYFFEESTFTHCKVWNLLPSISAAIGNYQPQRIVWQTAICLHIIPRFIVTYMYRQYYDEVIRMNRRQLAYLACILNLMENCALLGLTLWTSVNNYEVHKFSFSLFIAMSEIYMLLSFALLKQCRRVDVLTRIEQKSIDLKRNLFVINVFSFAIAGYFFLRHNSYCEPWIYTLFALFEYFVVLTNMGFHMTAYWDFYNRRLAFDWQHGLYLSSIV